MKAPFFSIIVPVYNAEKFLVATLDSIVSQSFQDFELILINDGSTDGSKNIIAEYKLKHPQIVVFDQGNQGQGEARNVGITHAKGKYFWFVDSDDTITPDALSFLYSRLSGEKVIDGVIFTCKVLEPIQQNIKDRIEHLNCGFDEGIEERVTSSKELLNLLIKGKMIPLCCNKVFSREIFEKSKFRFTKGIYFEDILFNATLFTNSGHIEIVRKDLYLYNQHIDSTMCSPCTDKHIYSIFTALSEVYAFLKKEGLYQEQAFCAFYWRQLTFIYHKFLKDADVEKNLLFLSELSKSTAQLTPAYYIPEEDDKENFPFAILLKVITEYENMNEEMEGMVIESFNFPQEFVDNYM